MASKFHAEGDAVDYTPPAAMVAGDAVKFGDFIGVANNDIPANVKGALRVNGIFRMDKEPTMDEVFLGAEYDFDFTNQRINVNGAGDADVQIFGARDHAAGDLVVEVFINKVG